MNPNVQVFERLCRQWYSLSIKYSLLASVPGLRAFFGGRGLLRKKSAHALGKALICQGLAEDYARNPRLQIEA